MFLFRNKMSKDLKTEINNLDRRTAIAGMVISDHEDCLGFISLLYGTDGSTNTLSRDDFIAGVQDYKCSWIFDRDYIRYLCDNDFNKPEILEHVQQQGEANYWSLDVEYQPSERGIRAGGDKLL